MAEHCRLLHSLLEETTVAYADGMDVDTYLRCGSVEIEVRQISSRNWNNCSATGAAPCSWRAYESEYGRPILGGCRRRIAWRIF